MFIASRVRSTITYIIVIFTFLTTVGAQVITKKPIRSKAAAPKETITDSVARYKIDSQLLEAIAQYKSGNKMSKTGREPVNVGADSSGALSVDISAPVSDSLLHTIISLGGKIIYSSQEYRTIRAILHLSAIEKIAARKDVSFIQPAVQAHNNAAPQPRLQPHSN